MLGMVENMVLLFVVVGSMNVLMVNNPVQSLLWLIFTFALSSMFFMFLGVELMSIIVFMMYMGAIAVLFLFVIMMLNMKVIELRSFYLRYLSMGVVIICFFILEIFLSIFFEFSNFYYDVNVYEDWFILLNFDSNLFLMGSMVFNYNFFLFFMLGMILLVAMICSIVLLVKWDISVESFVFYNNLYFFNYKKIFFMK